MQLFLNHLSLCFDHMAFFKFIVSCVYCISNRNIMQERFGNVLLKKKKKKKKREMCIVQKIYSKVLARGTDGAD